MNFINSIQILLIICWTLLSAIVAAIGLLVSKNCSFWIAKNFWAKIICKIVRCKVDMTGLENIKSLDKPAIFCANHLSTFDIIAIYTAIDRPIYFIAKKELQNVPFLGWYMQLSGMIFIDRSNKEKAISSMRHAGKMINNGKNIITFPEGTRSKSGKIGLFKRGSFIIALEGEIPIVPIAIKGSEKINPNRSFLLNKGVIQISVGKAINVEEVNHIPDELAKKTQQKVIELYQNLE